MAHNAKVSGRPHHETENSVAGGLSDLTDVLATRRSKATHRRKIGGTLFQLSKPDDDYPDNAWWFNEGSGMWQVSEYTNDEIRFGAQFEVANGLSSGETPP
jgi:hypothetical protein